MGWEDSVEDRKDLRIENERNKLKPFSIIYNLENLPFEVKLDDESFEILKPINEDIKFAENSRLMVIKPRMPNNTEFESFDLVLFEKRYMFIKQEKLQRFTAEQYPELYFQIIKEDKGYYVCELVLNENFNRGLSKKYPFSANELRIQRIESLKRIFNVFLHNIVVDSSIWVDRGKPLQLQLEFTEA